MSKKLENNGLWESSRMMLPQHKEALQNRRNNKATQSNRPTTGEINRMREYVLFPIMHSIILKKAQEMESSSETLKFLYCKVTRLLARKIYEDFSVLKKEVLQNNIRIFEEEKDDQMIRYRYVYYQYEDRFTITRDYMRAEISMKIGRYVEELLNSLVTPSK